MCFSLEPGLDSRLQGYRKGVQFEVRKWCIFQVHLNCTKFTLAAAAQKQWKTPGFRHIGQRRVALRCGEYLLNRRKLFWLQKNSFFLKNYEFRSWLEPQPHLGFLGRSEPETLNRPERLSNSSKTVENIVFCTLSLFDSDEMSTLRRLRKKWNFASRFSHSTIFAVRPPVQRTQKLTLRSTFSTPAGIAAAQK